MMKVTVVAIMIRMVLLIRTVLLLMFMAGMEWSCLCLPL